MTEFDKVTIKIGEMTVTAATPQEMIEFLQRHALMVLDRLAESHKVRADAFSEVSDALAKAWDVSFQPKVEL